MNNSVTVVIPTYNESGNIRELVNGLNKALEGVEADILFVDDSSDNTPEVIWRTADEYSNLPISMIHRDEATGGLSGAVVAGISAAKGDIVVVCDADLQHPPSMVDGLINELVLSGSNLVVASRYMEGRKVAAFGKIRLAVSVASNLLARSLFPRRLNGRTDLMSGFFAFRKEAINVEKLRPNGFKILLEILGTHDLTVSEVPFTFGQRMSGESNASAAQGVAFLKQLFHLRVPSKGLAFAMVGAVGHLPNIGILALLDAMGMNYVLAACIAVQAGVLFNFAGAETLVWHDRRIGDLRTRAAKFWAVGNLDLLRIPLVVLLVEGLPLITPVEATLVTFVVFFPIRYILTHTLVYRKSAVALSVEE